MSVYKYEVNYIYSRSKPVPIGLSTTFYELCVNICSFGTIAQYVSTGDCMIILDSFSPAKF